MNDFNYYLTECHMAGVEKGFWDNERNIGEMLMLVVTELSEALEAHRCNNFENFKEEIADTFIRLFDLSDVLCPEIEKEILKKMEYNKTRPKLHGKRY